MSILPRFNDATTGLAWSATGVMGLRAGSATVDTMTINNGKVGIGTTSPVSKLDVWGDFRIGTSSTPTLFTQVSTGRVGIGTSTPSARLAVSGLSGSTADIFRIASSTNDILFNVTREGKVGIGTGSPLALLHLYNPGTDNGAGARIAFGDFALDLNPSIGERGSTDSDQLDVSGKFGIYFRTGDVGSNDDRMVITTAGNVGVGTTSANQKLTVDGTMRLTGSVAVTDDRTLCTIAATGEIELKNGACGTSASRYKENVETLGYGLEEIRNLRPVFFNYLTDSDVEGDLDLKDGRTKRRIGFIAEEMNEIAPETVIWNIAGEIDGIDYAYLTALLANGFKDFDTEFTKLMVTGSTSATSSLKHLNDKDTVWQKMVSLVSGLVDGVLTLVGIETEKVTTDELCVGDICVTEEQFREVFGGSATNSNSGSSSGQNTNNQPVEPEPEPVVDTATTTPQTIIDSSEDAASSTDEEPITEEPITEENLNTSAEEAPEPVPLGS